MHFIKKHFLTIIGILIGSLGGYAYYFFVGCASGTCAITSNPLNSTLYGAMMGGLLFSAFKNHKPNYAALLLTKIILACSSSHCLSRLKYLIL